MVRPCDVLSAVGTAAELAGCVTVWVVTVGGAAAATCDDEGNCPAGYGASDDRNHTAQTTHWTLLLKDSYLIWMLPQYSSRRSETRESSMRAA